MTFSFNKMGNKGHLGNQMFQYAATLTTARQLGVTFMVPNHDEIFNDGIGNKLRILLFECFNVKIWSTTSQPSSSLHQLCLS